MKKQYKNILFWSILALTFVLSSVMFYRDGEFYVWQQYVARLIKWGVIVLSATGGIMVTRLLYRKYPVFVQKGMYILVWLFPAVVYGLSEFILGNLPTIVLMDHLKNLLIYYLIFWLLSVLINDTGFTLLIYAALLNIITLGQYFVILFRGRPVYLHDIFAVKTAAAVVANYTFTFNNQIYLSLLICFIVIILGKLYVKQIHCQKRIKILGTSLVVVIISLMTVFYAKWFVVIDMWDISATYATSGNVVTLLSQIPYFEVKAPEGYSVAAVEESISEYAVTPADNKIQPHNIILIMNETFSDLEYIGEIQTEEELMPYWKTIEENAIKGFLHMPVFGAGTANSEYEVLTGNAMEFMPGGSIAYQINVREDEKSLVEILEKQGYSSSALHPYYRENWNRDEVYTHMGFDEFYSIENWGEWKNLRWCVSDENAYDKVIEVDSQSDDKQFIFLVTMQNHGGYAEEWDNFTNEVTLGYEAKYAEAEQYLSLMQESDRAFKELLDFYRESDEPTLIVLFGDHQAVLEEEFYEELFGKPLSELTFEESQDRYVTPFVIWANYDIEEKEDVVMSSNYLGSYVLECAGLELSGYNRFLLDMMQEIPVIGIGGMQSKEGDWYQWYNVPEIYADKISAYKILQYNNVYDRKNRISDIFTIEDEE